MAVNHCEVRDVDVAFLCVTLIGLMYLTVLNKAQMGFINPVVLSSFSHKFADLFKIPVSCTETTDFRVSPQSLKIFILALWVMVFIRPLY
jgi:hypothetical protein